MAAPVLVGLAYVVGGALDLVGFGGVQQPGPRRVLRVLGEGLVWRGVLWSLWVAAASTAIATAAAIVLALAFRGNGRTDRIARAAAVLPLPVPHVVAGLAALLILAQSGVLARLAHAGGWVGVPSEMPALVYDPWGAGAIAALIWKELPFLALVAFSVLARRGAALEEAARTLGATGRQAARRVTLPVIWRGMLPAVVAVFVFAFGSYEIAVLLAPSDPLPLPILMLERYTGPSLEQRGDAFVLALLAMFFAAAAVVAHERVRGAWDRLEG